MQSPLPVSDAHTVLANLLAPCLEDTPTAGAVIIINSAESASFTLVNMTHLEASRLLRATTARIEQTLGGNLGTLQ